MHGLHFVSSAVVQMVLVAPPNTAILHFYDEYDRTKAVLDYTRQPFRRALGVKTPYTITNVELAIC